MIQKISTQQAVHKYEILDNIYPINSMAYIDTGIVADNDTYLEVKYKTKGSTNNYYCHLIGIPSVYQNQSSNPAFRIYYHRSTHQLKIQKNTSASLLNEYWVDDDTVWHTIKLDHNTLYFDNNQVSQRSEVWTTYNNDTMLLFAARTNTDQGQFYVEYLKIGSDNLLVRDYVPAKRLSDNVIGLYDKLNDVFYTNAGTGEFGGTAKSTPEYIDEQGVSAVYVNDIKFNGISINRIYLNDEVYWGGDVSSSPQPTGRYIPAVYCMNNNNITNYQSNKAAFSIPWAPDPSVAHMIDVELEPVLRSSSFYGWTVFFGGNTSTQSHMGNVYGLYAQYNKLYAGAFSFTIENNSIFINNYFNKLWKIQISNDTGTSSQRDYSVSVDVEGTTILSGSATSTYSNFGTFDPYFIFGGQIERNQNAFATWQYKLYKFDIYDDNVLVYQLRPYYDTIEQEYGMYDLVNNIFYPSMNAAYPFTGELPT